MKDTNLYITTNKVHEDKQKPAAIELEDYKFFKNSDKEFNKYKA